MKTQCKQPEIGAWGRAGRGELASLAGLVPYALFLPPVLDTYKQSAQLNRGMVSLLLKPLAITINVKSVESPGDQGFLAGFMGFMTCPYLVGTSAGWAWSEGYTKGVAYAKSIQ